MITGRVQFPNQRVSQTEKGKPEWYANCCDYVIEAGVACKEDNIEEKFGILHGDIPHEYYRKTLNPYNFTEEKYKRYPATMRNYDIMKGIIRRYVGEYIKSPHDFIVGANNPEVVFAKDAKLAQEVMRIAEEAVAAEIQRTYQEYLGQGGDPNQFNIQEQVNIEEFIKDFNEKFIDDISAQGQNLLSVIDDITDSFVLYARAYFEFVAFGECYTYSDVDGEQFIKRVVSARDAFPVPNDSLYVKDYDMFAERRMMTKQQIITEFGDYLSDNEIEALNNTDYYGSYYNTDKALLNWDNYMKYFGDTCNKFSDDERKSLKDSISSIMARDRNNNLIEVWHTVWRGEAKQGILTFNNGSFVTTRIVDESYQFNEAAGDISIEWIWAPQTYESTRIGTRNTGIYPYKARPIAYQRDGELPYNGLTELLPGFGKFSIIDTVLPYQVFRNIVAYHREMVIAKNKMNILMLAKSLLGKKPDDTIYKMAADGVLYIDDEDDAGMLRAQQVRVLQADMKDYIAQLTELMEETEQQAMMAVDMTPQRYGEIATSAGKGVTDEAIMRGSMGSVIIEFMFDNMRKEDYQRDLDYTKLAWIDGLNTSYRTVDGQIRYISLDVNNHIFADYVVAAKNSVKEKEKLEQYRQLAFSAAQNGNMDMANAAIRGENVSQISELIDKFQNVQRQHELQLEQVAQQTEQLRQEAEMQKIAMKGEQDRETLRLEKYLDGQIEAMKANANIMSFDNGLNETEKNQAEERMEAARNNIEMMKVNVQREQIASQERIKNKEIAAKIYDSDNKLKIAKQNKNRHDK